MKKFTNKFALALVVLLCVFGSSLHAQLVLDNNRLRFGTGTEPSVNASGNLQQPFYYNSAAALWRKLTYSNYPLDNAFAVGGDKTNEWNVNGTIVVNPAMSGQTIDASSFVATSGSRGYGTIISTGTINVGGQLMEVRNTYFLPQASAYVKVTTRLRNVSAAQMDNVRTWIGTRDDWVGVTDAPRKQKGNLANNAFVQNSSSSARALALKISTGTEGVLFYSQNTKGNIIVHPNYGDFYSRIVLTNPTSSSLDITSDGSYGFYVRMNDLAPGASDEFIWYYAAGELAQLDDIIADVANVSGAVQNITQTTADFRATATAASTGYWMVIPRNAANPTAAQIKAGASYNGVTVAASGSGAMTANVERIFNLSGLTANTQYDLHFVSQDANQAFSNILEVAFTTLPNPPTALCRPYAAAIAGNGVATVSAANINNGSFSDGGAVTLSIASGRVSFTCADLGQTFPVELRVTDAHSQSSTCTAMITVTDPLGVCNQPPVARCQPLTRAAGTDCRATASAAEFNNGSTDPNGDAMSFSVSPAGPYALGTTQVTLTVTDSKGASNSCVTSITVIDNTAPVPNQVSLPTVTGTCSASVTAPTASDACSGIILATTNDPISYSTQGTHIIHWTYRDAAGNFTEQMQTVIVRDETAPVIACAFDITVNSAPNSCGAVVNYNAPSATDNCGSGSLPTQLEGYTYKGLRNGHAYFVSNFATNPEDAHARAIALGGHLVTISDAQENAFVSAMSPGFIWIGHTDRSSEGTFTWVTSEPVNYTNWNGGEPNNYGGNEDWAVINWGPNGTWNDWFYYENALFVVEFEGGAIPTNLVSGLGSGATFPIGTTTETWEAVDAAGNRAICSFNVTVVDVENPTIINMPESVLVHNDRGECGARISWPEPSSADNCQGHSIAQIGGMPSGSLFPIGTSVITYRATDASGLTYTKSFTIRVRDTERPSIVNLPANMVVSNDPGVCGAAVTWAAPMSADNCSPHFINQVGGQPSGTIFPVGISTVTYLAQDAAGNSVSGSFIITVEDREAPVLAGIPADATVECDAVPAAATVTATDNCAFTGQVQYHEERTNGSCPSSYTLRRTWTTTDAAGNSSTASQVITVRDTQAPMLTVADITASSDAGQCGAVVAFDYPATDNCSTPSVSYSHASGTMFPVGNTVVTATATDACGNATVRSFTIHINDVEAPVVTSAVGSLDATVECSDAQAIAAALAQQPSGSDNCSPVTRHLVSDATTTGCGATYVRVRQWNFTDPSGNASTTFTQTINVVDRTAPVVTSNAGSVEHCYNTSNQYAVAALSATDNCTAVTYAYVVKDAAGATVRSGNGTNASGTFPVGMNTIQWTVTDACGNSSTATTSVRINAPINGTFNTFTVIPNGAQANTLYLGYTPASSASITITATGGTPGFTYQWSKQGSAATFTVNAANPSKIDVVAAGQGTVTFTVIVTDSKGCSKSFQKTINVMDVRCGNKMDKVLVCHNTGSGSNPWVQVCVAPAAVNTQLGNGGYLGTCTGSVARYANPAPAIEASISAYPNPSRGLVQLRVNGLQGKLRIEVLDSRGSRLLQREQNVTFKTEDVTLDLQSAASGLYTIRVTDGTNVLSTRVAIAR